MTDKNSFMNHNLLIINECCRCDRYFAFNWNFLCFGGISQYEKFIKKRMRMLVFSYFIGNLTYILRID